MKHAEVHDLLQIDHASLNPGCGAEHSWAKQMMQHCPWVVVRRSRAASGEIAIGVRGDSRNERWAAFCERSLVREVVRPEELLRTSSDMRRTPALRSLQDMRERWADLTLPWGPGGSVGFELASGRNVTTEASDLDLILRAQRRITVEEARFLLDRTQGLEAKVDVRVETPVCGFALEEYASASAAKILLRYPDRIRLGDDPWRGEA